MTFTIARLATVHPPSLFISRKIRVTSENYYFRAYLVYDTCRHSEWPIDEDPPSFPPPYQEGLTDVRGGKLRYPERRRSVEDNLVGRVA